MSKYNPTRRFLNASLIENHYMLSDYMREEDRETVMNNFTKRYGSIGEESFMTRDERENLILHTPRFSALYAKYFTVDEVINFRACENISAYEKVKGKYLEPNSGMTDKDFIVLAQCLLYWY